MEGVTITLPVQKSAELRDACTILCNCRRRPKDDQIMIPTTIPHRALNGMDITAFGVPIYKTKDGFHAQY